MLESTALPGAVAPAHFPAIAALARTTQLRQLREHARHRGFEVVGEFVDHASGRRNDRGEYNRLFEAVQRRDVDVVLVWRYDRFARSTHALINALTEFHSRGVDFISLQKGTDTTMPQGKLVFTIMAGLAEFESALSLGGPYAAQHL